MIDYHQHLISDDQSIKEALTRFSLLAMDAILFVVDKNDVLLGSLTDGDVRRGFIKGLTFDDSLLSFIEPHPIFINKKNYSVRDVNNFRKKNIKIIPIVDDNRKVISVLNLRLISSLLPLDALIMAGGEGRRLRPLTEHTPKPLLKVGDLPIIEYNIDRLISFGVQNLNISINYLGHQLVEYFGNGEAKSANIRYISESKPLGTIGALSLVEKFEHDTIIVMNSDLLTNIDFEDFYLEFIDSKADMGVATIPYNVNIPYAVFETKSEFVVSLKEKPTYTYYSNAGIYLIKKELISYIEKDQFLNVTDLMETFIREGKKILSYPLLSYWLDIGRYEDYMKAQEDIKHIKF